MVAKTIAAAAGAAVLCLVGAILLTSGSPATMEALQTTDGQTVTTTSLYKTGEPSTDFPKPSAAAMKLKSPKEWKAHINTNVGPFTVLVHREWAPKGADRFYSLVMNDFYDGGRFFRYADNFVVQWGLKGEPHIDEMYENGANINDDSPKKSNSAGRITFATSGTDTRSTQVFVNLADNTFLDDQGFTPFGELATAEDLDLFKHKINAEYGEKADQNKIISEGNSLYLQKAFPHMSYIKAEKVEVITP
eukprot:CAMPEP_0173437624 /NCGR_PEP_ID=MMETSP1357-20121228/18129_1 /TAXON_ID=77926 /ORGANISM="Hemiselmis rufescens, Strain PCC563" /LENGTH=247 /DNA_ID=CAMNT_0014402817 /DNA_START=1 /DNA_END=744 /DNA_ORIENTATION=-